MRRVAFDPATHPGIHRTKWDRWAARAENAKRAVETSLAAAEETKADAPDLDSSVWTALKDILLEPVFRGRCAYCEVNESVSGFGDAEHYRPKRAVVAPDAEDKLKILVVDGSPHPGYAWLAYDWQNLIPACSKCNTYKGNQFPVEGKHVLRPKEGSTTTEELNACEKPLLLHPYFDDPSDHMEVGERGLIAPKNGSARGKATIEVCQLSREPLRAAREKEQKNIWLEVTDMMRNGVDLAQAIVTIQRRCDAGEESFSLAILDHLWRRLEEHIEEQRRKLAAAEELRASRLP